ncbi:MAG: M23 family metallopeptidase [Solidesulfovibrio sp. DCME]|uniref:M23 family metallopeptidase n=1 Tax=Solidesulfovibrio sp. DCME TaxID=3447380 RepID=UPI003D1116B4
MFKNYQIVIFRDHHGACRKLRFRGWLFAAILLALAGLLAADVYLVQYYYNFKRIAREADALEGQARDQDAQIAGLSDKVKGLEADLSRLRGFDAKLRLMVGLDQEPRDVSPSGGEEKDFEKKYLPLYRQEMLTRKLHRYLDALAEDAARERLRQGELLAALGTGQARLSAMPASWPVEGWIITPFGEQVSPFTGRKIINKGLDIAAPAGTPVLAPGDGLVAFAGEADDGGFGVSLDHQAGLVTVYGGLRDVAVAKGQPVTRGQLLGHVADLGRPGGPQLHYEARLGGVPVNPRRYILE